MKKLEHMNSYELRDYLVFLGADPKRLYGTSNYLLRMKARELERTDGKVWCIVMDGDVVYRGCEMRCFYTMRNDELNRMRIGIENEIIPSLRKW